MIRRRTEARRRTRFHTIPLVALVAGLVLATGCSHGPKPKPDAAAEGTRDGRATTGTKHTSGTAAKPATGTTAAGTRNGASVTGATSGSSTTTATGVVPQVTAAEQERLERETKTAMEAAQKELDAIDAPKLDVERNRKYLIAKDFLVQAGEARSRGEYERAQGLAQKARLLAAEIAAR